MFITITRTIKTMDINNPIKTNNKVIHERMRHLQFAINMCKNK